MLYTLITIETKANSTYDSSSTGTGRTRKALSIPTCLRIIPMWCETYF